MQSNILWLNKASLVVFPVSQATPQPGLSCIVLTQIGEVSKSLLATQYTMYSYSTIDESPLCSVFCQICFHNFQSLVSKPATPPNHITPHAGCI